MKYPFLTLALSAAVLFCGSLSVAHADAAPKTSVTKAEKKKQAKKGKKALKAPKVSGVVGQYLLDLPEERIWVKGEMDTNADFYVFLLSASWCGNCVAEMPQMVEAHRKMREEGSVELVLIAGDRTQEAAQEFTKKFGAKFAAITAIRNEQPTPPGFQKLFMIPYANILDKDGKLIKSGNASIINDWEEYTIHNPDYAEWRKEKKNKRAGKKNAASRAAEVKK